MMTKIPILIAGPTASGKSRLALELAKRLDGAIINTDSMQVYKDLRIISARPSVEEEAQAPHYLYGVLDASRRCSAGMWGRMVLEILPEIEAKGLRPIFVGGTGLYFKALTEGLSSIPEIPPQIRANAEAILEDGGIAALFADLEEQDPATAASLRNTDPQRVQRAWEVWQATGRGLSEWQTDKQQPILKGPVDKIVLEPDRQKLYARCDLRLDQMVASGGLEEVSALLERELDAALPVLKALGVPEMKSHLHEDESFDTALERAKMMTRRYAKRQLTWIRNQMTDWPRLDPASTSLVKDALSLIDGA